MKKTRGAGDDRRKIFEESRRKHVEKNLQYGDAAMKKVEILRRAGDTRTFYQQVRRHRESYTPPTTPCNDASGNRIVNDDDERVFYRTS